mmetsp:Transcript_12001/g.22006  ORF Transcript_12001/g.22006 Transcript_12001/m.22006 type:complete len:82 (-) Transcript_12001:15-260(-)
MPARRAHRGPAGNVVGATLLAIVALISAHAFIAPLQSGPRAGKPLPRVTEEADTKSANGDFKAFGTALRTHNSKSESHEHL